MLRLGDTVEFTASKYQTRYVSADASFSVCVFTTRFDENVIPHGMRQYGPTVMFVAKGRIPESETGIKFRMKGSWAKNPKAANEAESKIFELTSCMMVLPEKAQDIANFLVNNCKTVGKKQAKQLAEQYGPKTIDICAHHPEMLHRDFPLLTQKRIDKISQACLAVLVMQDFEKLVGGNIPQEVVYKIVEAYGENALRKAETNAYAFVPLVGFTWSDKIAIAAGEKLDSPRRIAAGVSEAIRAVGRKTGCLCVSGTMVREETNVILERSVSLDIIQQNIDALCASYDVVKQGDWLYEKDDFVLERLLARKLARFVTIPAEKEEEIEKALQKWQSEHSIVLSARQTDAVRNLKYRLSIVTGGPGTGKTTTLRAILDVYHEVFPHEQVLLMAPTGLAAKRMTDSTQCPSSTIHSACGLIPSTSSSGFEPQDECYITDGFIGIDEMSMVGEHLFGYTMDAIQLQKNTRVVLLGDVDQLAPVARGDVLRDLIACGMVPTTVLDCNYRQGKDSAITDASIKIREDKAYSEEGNCMLNFNDDDLSFIPCENDDLRAEADEIISFLVDEYLAGVAKYGVQGTIILTPTHFDKGKPSGYLCKDVLNKVVQERINPDTPTKASCKIGQQVFREGDRVIQRKNTSVVINGDLGTIQSITSDGEGDMQIQIMFDSKTEPLEYGLKDMRNVELAYAITIHSSQGCEFPMCIMPVSMSFSVMLTRAVYYTGITRAKKRLVLIGNHAALRRALENKRRGNRKSLLGPRIITKVKNAKNCA